MKLLLLSNSTNYGQPYMDWCAELVADFARSNSEHIVFVPYAAAGFSYAQYTERVNKALSAHGIQVHDVSHADDPVAEVERASAIFVGGGNSFQLLKCLQELKLIQAIQKSVSNGVPYAGWSAGSNIAGPSIKTTNDMPIVQPPSFEALELIPYQINPHFTDQSIPDHGGETRSQRLEEFLALNQDSKVLCLPEGAYLKQEGLEMTYLGTEGGLLMEALGVKELRPGQRIVI